METWLVSARACVLQITVETHSDIRLMTQDGDCSSNVTTPWSLASSNARPWNGADDVINNEIGQIISGASAGGCKRVV